MRRLDYSQQYIPVGGISQSRVEKRTIDTEFSRIAPKLADLRHRTHAIHHGGIVPGTSPIRPRGAKRSGSDDNAIAHDSAVVDEQGRVRNHEINIERRGIQAAHVAVLSEREEEAAMHVLIG
jgi:hypothetical protein